MGNATLRIVGIRRATDPADEFVLLQNQGSLRAHLRGHAVMDDGSLQGGLAGPGVHLFADDVHIPPGMYVLLISGPGQPRWCRSKDGALIYHAYMGRRSPVWSRLPGPFHVLGKVHTFTERREVQEPRHSLVGAPE